MDQPAHSPSFEIRHESEPSGTLVAGFASFGLAGLIATGFLVDQFELTETGHIVAEGLPAFTPFENGRPRHHSRLFSRPDLDVTILVNDLFVPVGVADSFGAAILDWADANAVEEITVLAGAPFPHQDHGVLYVATDDYRDYRLGDGRFEPMASGSLDGINASLMSRGIDSPLRVGLFVTPVHTRVPDVDGAIRLVETVGTLYGLDVDASPLESFAAEVDQYYRDLAARVEAAEEETRPDDRMYM
ncbi:uncharacterized protein SAMN04487949_1381 [Halogranum gelatinilyticum]|uniref:Proteasome assembly chaperone family protein n=1 Tax=Halogranum gelatinilyticum TaxID=660521 RepID=A0A1G9SIW1_9EURY|nr:PAC2 family protein [Halogranum gelatinilyticum]SDM35351.1 uncharacterized protein SAMN04487949_1381 [Halogranum gelatinilyticum]